MSELDQNSGRRSTSVKTRETDSYDRTDDRRARAGKVAGKGAGNAGSKGENAQSSTARNPVGVRQAVIMAGGKGARLMPYSALLPKPLMPLGDMPILELLLWRLKKAGVTEVILAVNHLRHLIEAYFGDGSKFGIKIRYCVEAKPLGTAGALGNMIDMLDDTFFLTNGDLLTSLDLEGMTARHFMAGADATIGVYQRELKIDFGLIEFDGQSRLSAYREKPTSKYHVSMGIYLLQRDAVRPHVVAETYLDMPNLLLQMKSSDANVFCYNDECIWLDIGRPDDFALAQTLFEQDKSLFIGR